MLCGSASYVIIRIDNHLERLVRAEENAKMKHHGVTRRNRATISMSEHEKFQLKCGSIFPSLSFQGVINSK